MIRSRQKSIGTLDDAWNQASPGSKLGAKACPTCGKDVHVKPKQGPRDWDVDHNPKWAERDFPNSSSRKTVLDNYNTGTRLRCPSCNRADNKIK